jgi:hypothetical protein
MSETPKHVRGDLTTHIMDKVVQAANDVADLVDIDEEPEGYRRHIRRRHAR